MHLSALVTVHPEPPLRQVRLLGHLTCFSQCLEIADICFQFSTGGDRGSVRLSILPAVT